MPEQEKSEHQKRFEETVKRMANTPKGAEPKAVEPKQEKPKEPPKESKG